MQCHDDGSLFHIGIILNGYHRTSASSTTHSFEVCKSFKERLSVISGLHIGPKLIMAPALDSMLSSPRRKACNSFVQKVVGCYCLGIQNNNNINVKTQHRTTIKFCKFPLPVCVRGRLPSGPFANCRHLPHIPRLTIARSWCGPSHPGLHTAADQPPVAHNKLILTLVVVTGVIVVVAAAETRSPCFFVGLRLRL